MTESKRDPESGDTGEATQLALIERQPTPVQATERSEDEEIQKMLKVEVVDRKTSIFFENFNRNDIFNRLKNVSKRLLCASLVVIFIIVTIVIANALMGDGRGINRDTYFSARNIPLPRPQNWNVDAKHFLGILTDAITFRTISYDGEKSANLSAHVEFGNFLKLRFPFVHNSTNVDREIIAKASLLYKIEGVDASLKPYLLISHLDVVPTENADQWDRDPFGGDERDDSAEDEYLYGRGTLDVKSSVIGILGALETMLSRNDTWRPKRTIMLFFGHDEEIGGFQGAKVAAEKLKERKVALEFILDEGGSAARNFFPVGERLVCLIGVAEKGFMSVEVEATAHAGHSSMPPEKTAIGVLAKALTALEANPLPYHFEPYDINRKSFEWIAPYLSFWNRLAMTNIWLLKPAVLARVTSTPETRALARTTTALTVVSGGIKDNVLPEKARALVNHRLHPGDDVDYVLKWDKRCTSGIEGVTLRAKPGWRNEASPIAPHGEDDAAYHVVKTSIHTVLPEAVVIPYLTVGGTDSKHFVHLTNKIYRFVPFVLDKYQEDAKRIHGVNERIRKSDFDHFVQFYLSIIELADRI